MDIRNIKSIDDLIIYFTEELNWKIDLDDFDEIDDITYDFDAADIGLKEEAFAKITSLRQLQPLCDEQKWGIFCVEFDSNKFEVSALRKILSGLIPKRRNAADHAVWAQKDLLFLCFWGTDNNRTIGIAHFEDKNTGLPQIKMISCAPAVEDFTQIRIFEERIGHLSWVKDVTDTQAWYEQWSSAFVTAYHQVIRDSASLTVKLAAEAQAIRDRILDIYAVETHDGYVHKLFKDFKDNLIHDMTKQQFADMYAQTVVYGLFSARCMDKTQGDFNVQEAIKCIPNTNPFLKRLMEECLGESSERHLTFDELEVANVVEILTHTNTDLILADFNRQTGGGREDPVIHFYEEFLTAYDKGQKVDRGVFYTPQPVVNFIVRAVDSILKNDLGLDDGLASEQTKDIMIEVEGKKRRERCEVPAVQILDPATGTGTFLRQTILQIYDNFRTKHKGESEEQIKKAWNEYVPKHLLPRLNGFELMMAPYAVAHMKLAMVLKDTGYDFSGDQRLNVFLTNSLEEAGKDDFQMTLFDNDPLAFESIEANQAKKNNGINVIIGNPPYNVSSNNKNPWISDLIQEYKRGLSERKLNLDDDYIKFLRLAQTIVEGADKGVVGFITNNSFIDGITHRQIRKNLVNTFDKIYIINFHGNIMAHEKCPDGSKDENVFPITQGVSIFIGVRNKTVKEKGAYHIDMMGTRDYKFNWLNQNIIDEIHWSALSLDDDKCMFVPVDTTSLGAYKDGFNVDALFRLYNSGIQTKCDELSVKNTESELQEIIDSFLENDVESLKRLYPNKSDSSGWSFEKAKSDLLQGGYIITPYYYRPFDFKYTVYTGRSSGFIGRSRDIVMKHIINHPENSSLCLMKQFFQDITYNHVFITTMPIDERTLYSNRGGTYLFPLYLYSSELGENKKEYNFNSGIISKIEHSLGLKLAYSVQENHFTGENLIDYIYAVLYSNKYRLAYNDFLKVDFPRVPYPTDQETFWELVEIGGKLRECHLMHTEFDTAPYSFIGDGTNEVVKPEYKNGRVYISKTQYFDNVPQTQWEQYIGGYQPLQKWLKDRKKTTLSAEDIKHYKKIIAALRLTEELMVEIDRVVEF